MLYKTQNRQLQQLNRNKDFLAATQKNIAPATTPAPASMAAGGRVFYLQGGLASLLR
jgi:hypothetical protein